MEKSVRTLQQNRFYFGVVLPKIEQNTHISCELLHEIFIRKFLKARTIQYRGQNIIIPGSSKACTKTEFGEYIDKVLAEAVDMGIDVSDLINSPNE